MSGKVTLVGAGPGDVGLLTIKGREVIEQADVVVYDRLVSPEILALIPEGTRTINVGKASSNHLVPQEEINQILLREGLAGNHAVRLKGGDPFLFGRGGEELELLVEHGVEFQEIPGITSAIAVPAYGGIPVTHRDCCSSLHIITGHARAGKELDIKFDALVGTEGTLVFLMGVSALPKICEGLLKAGMAPEMPAAVIERGTTPRQRRISATLATLPATAAEEQVESPAIIVVGKVCALADDFDWFDKLPLKGTSTIVTRPKERAGTLSAKLRALGASVTEYPCIETVDILPCPQMEEALNNLAHYEWLTFTSPAGVETLWRMMSAQGRDARWLGGVKLAAIGTGTDKMLRKHGLSADFIPQVFDAQHLGEGLAQIATGRVLILRAEEGSPALTDGLEQAKIDFDDVAIYTTRYENPQSQALRQQMEGGDTLVTFTSASTVKGFVASVGEDADFSKVMGVCIGKQTAAQASKYGIETIIAKSATMDAMVTAILNA